jgi:TolB-like protein
MGLIIISLIFIAGATMAAKPLTVAILPFQINSTEDLSYLQKGILDMLSTRIASEESIQVIDREKVFNAIEEWKGEINFQKALKLGQTLQADFIIFGSITKIGVNISLDGTMVDVNKGKVLAHVYSNPRGMDEVIPKVNDFAQEIRGKITGLTTPGKDTVSTTSSIAPQQFQLPSKQGKGPLYPVPFPMPYPSHSDETIFSDGEERESIEKGKKTLNPAFIQTYQADKEKRGYLKSPDLPLRNVIGIDAGDVDGDGKIETIIMDDRTVIITKDVMHGLSSRKVISGSAMDNYLSIDVADINKNKIEEIYITNIVKGKARSFCLEYQGGEFRRIAEELPWLFKVVDTPERGRVLLGQEMIRLPMIDKASDGMISPLGNTYVLSWKGGKLVAGEKVNIPPRINILGLNFVDIDRTGIQKIIAFDDREYLNIYSMEGKLLWRSKEKYGGSDRFFEKHIDRQISPFEEPILQENYIPLRIVVADTDEDGIPEIIVAKNTEPISLFYTKFYNRSALLSLSWDGIDLAENWRTREMKGYIADYQVKDIDNDGKPEVVVVLCFKSGMTDYVKSRSTVVAYKLHSK